MTNKQKATKAMEKAIELRDYRQGYWLLNEYKEEHNPTNGDASPNAVAVVIAKLNGDTIRITLRALGEHRWEVNLEGEEDLICEDWSFWNTIHKKLGTIINNNPSRGLERFRELFLGFQPAMWHDFKRGEKGEETQALIDLKPL